LSFGVIGFSFLVDRLHSRSLSYSVFFLLNLLLIIGNRPWVFGIVSWLCNSAVRRRMTGASQTGHTPRYKTTTRPG
jgi:hypothetical protein